MQEKLDYLDNIIKNTYEEINVSENYNQKLMKKIDGLDCQKKYVSENRRIAMSFILAGLLTLVFYSTDLQYKFKNIEIQAKSNLNIIETNIRNFDILKFFMKE